ncbi:hypothetical protein BDZ45DRAFT_733284 [Acephala macrosclerotiorum]|nr:hypothetical protein BDZ45DRAFT_733284 [Acephala macrosclerotiorum]
MIPGTKVAFAPDQTNQSRQRLEMLQFPLHYQRRCSVSSSASQGVELLAVNPRASKAVIRLSKLAFLRAVDLIEDQISIDTSTRLMGLACLCPKLNDSSSFLPLHICHIKPRQDKVIPPPTVIIDASEPLKKIPNIIVRDGGVIIANFLSPELLKKTMAASEQWRRAATTLRADRRQWNPIYPAVNFMTLKQLMKNLVMASFRKAGSEYIDERSYTGEKLPSQKNGYMLASTAALRLTPGAKPQPLHRVRHSIFRLGTGSNSTYKNGLIAVVPGSNVWGPERSPKRRTTYRGAGENKCEAKDPDDLRTLIVVFAQRDYYRQDQDEVLSAPVEIARKLPEDILKLASYCKRPPRLNGRNDDSIGPLLDKAVGGVGYVKGHQHPFEFLHKDDASIGNLGLAI